MRFDVHRGTLNDSGGSGPQRPIKRSNCHNRKPGANTVWRNLRAKKSNTEPKTAGA